MKETICSEASLYPARGMLITRLLLISPAPTSRSGEINICSAGIRGASSFTDMPPFVHPAQFPMVSILKGRKSQAIEIAQLVQRLSRENSDHLEIPSVDTARGRIRLDAICPG